MINHHFILDILQGGTADLSYAQNLYGLCEKIDLYYQLDSESYEIKSINDVIYQCMSCINYSVFDYLKNEVEDLPLSESEKKVIKSYCIKQVEEPELFINALDSWYCNILDQIDFDS
uniref:hypothetical protein n=1 Tax=unclassified Cysteiniphilum TaxID=2610889 RepID=UPI003F82C3A2